MWSILTASRACSRLRYSTFPHPPTPFHCRGRSMAKQGDPLWEPGLIQAPGEGGPEKHPVAWGLVCRGRGGRRRMGTLPPFPTRTHS